MVRYRYFVRGLNDRICVKLNYRCKKGTVSSDSFECGKARSTDKQEARRGRGSANRSRSGDRRVVQGKRVQPTPDSIPNDPDIMGAKSVRDLLRVMESKTPGVVYAVDGLDLATAKCVCAQLHRVVSVYPQLLRSGLIKNVVTCDVEQGKCSNHNASLEKKVKYPGRVAASYVRSEATLVVNPNYMSKVANGSLSDGTARIHRFGYRFNVGTSVEELVTHEIGHAIEHYLLDKNVGVGGKYLDWDRVRDKVPDAYRPLMRENVHDIVDGFTQKLYSSSPPKDIASEVSQYASSENKHELFAEAFVMYTFHPPDGYGKVMSDYRAVMDVLLDESNYVDES